MLAFMSSFSLVKNLMPLSLWGLAGSASLSFPSPYHFVLPVVARWAQPVFPPWLQLSRHPAWSGEAWPKHTSRRHRCSRTGTLCPCCVVCKHCSPLDHITAVALALPRQWVVSGNDNGRVCVVCSSPHPPVPWQRRPTSSETGLCAMTGHWEGCQACRAGDSVFGCVHLPLSGSSASCPPCWVSNSLGSWWRLPPRKWWLSGMRQHFECILLLAHRFSATIVGIAAIAIGIPDFLRLGQRCVDHVPETLIFHQFPGCVGSTQQGGKNLKPRWGSRRAPFRWLCMDCVPRQVDDVGAWMDDPSGD